MENPETNNTQHTHFPYINTFNDILNYRDELVRVAKEHPMEDFIYYFPQEHYDRVGTGMATLKEKAWWGSQLFGNIKRDEGLPNCVVAGSAALHYLWSQLARHEEWKADNTCRNCIQYPSWQAGDADIFFLNANKAHRFSMGLVDFVYAPEQTPEELLLHFDLPCCRAAVSPAHDIWISGQCLAAIFSKTYYLPTYLQRRDKFLEVINAHRTPKQPEATPPAPYSNFQHAEQYLYDRLAERVKKYSQRGFSVVWVESDIVLPWIKHRFQYALWKEGFNP